MTIGIYKIIILSTGQTYIGSSRNVEKRIRQHKLCLRAGRHDCRPLQLAADDLEFSLIEACSVDLLRDREQAAMDMVSPVASLNKNRARDPRPSGLPQKNNDSPGVYRIVHLSGATYVGSSHKVQGRVTVHRRQLRGGFSHNRRLQDAWDSSFPEEWLFEIVISSSVGDELRAEEQQAILAVDRVFLLNTLLIPGSRKGVPTSATTRQLIRESKLGRKMTPEAVAINRAAQIARRLREKEAGIVRRLSPETKEKIRSKAVGRGHSPATKERIGNIVRGIKRRPETKKKMSDARKAYWERKRSEK